MSMSASIDANSRSKKVLQGFGSSEPSSSVRKWTFLGFDGGNLSIMSYIGRWKPSIEHGKMRGGEDDGQIFGKEESR